MMSSATPFCKRKTLFLSSTADASSMTLSCVQDSSAGSVFSRIGATVASIRLRPSRSAQQTNVLDYAKKIAFDPSRRNSSDCRAKNLHLVDVPVLIIGFSASERTQQAIEFLEGCVDLTLIEGVNGRDRDEVIQVANANEHDLEDHRIGCTLAHLRVSDLTNSNQPQLPL